MGIQALRKVDSFPAIKLTFNKYAWAFSIGKNMCSTRAELSLYILYLKLQSVNNVNYKDVSLIFTIIPTHR